MVELVHLDVISQISPRPLLMVHGISDKRITDEQAMHLFRVAKSPKELWILDGAGHSYVRTPGLDQLIQEIVMFFDATFKNACTRKFVDNQ